MRGRPIFGSLEPKITVSLTKWHKEIESLEKARARSDAAGGCSPFSRFDRGSKCSKNYTKDFAQVLNEYLFLKSFHLSFIFIWDYQKKTRTAKKNWANANLFKIRPRKICLWGRTRGWEIRKTKSSKQVRTILSSLMAIFTCISAIPRVEPQLLKW